MLALRMSHRKMKGSNETRNPDEQRRRLKQGVVSEETKSKRESVVKPA
jgi:hypothetical protein